MSRTFFYILLCFYQSNQDSTFMENVEETLKIEEYSFAWYCIDLWRSNLWKENRLWQKESIFLKTTTALRKNSSWGEHNLLTRFTNASRNHFDRSWLWLTTAAQNQNWLMETKNFSRTRYNSKTCEHLLPDDSWCIA